MSSSTSIGNNSITVLSNGNIGIGVTNPTSAFVVSGDMEIQGSLTSASFSQSGPYTTNKNGFISWVQGVTSDASANWWCKASTLQFNELTFAGTTLDGSVGTATKYSGCVLIPDGRVVFVPYSSNKLGIYDPINNTFTESTYTGTSLDGVTVSANKYIGGVLMPDGRVIFAPYASTKIGIYNPVSNTFTETASSPTNWLTGSKKFWGGVLVPDGRIIFNTYYYLYLGTYTPSTNTFTQTFVPNSILANQSLDEVFAGGVLLPDGRVVFVPFSYSKLCVYNPVSGTLTESIFAGTALTGEYGGASYVSRKYAGGVLLPDGRVVFVPYNMKKLGIYNPNTETYTETAYNIATTGASLNGVTTSATKYSGGVLLPDGNVCFIPYSSSNKLGIYNPTADTFTETTYANTSLNGSGTTIKYAGGILLPDGRVLFVPYNSNKLGILSGFPPVPKERCLHPAFNKL